MTSLLLIVFFIYVFFVSFNFDSFIQILHRECNNDKSIELVTSNRYLVLVDITHYCCCDIHIIDIEQQKNRTRCQRFRQKRTTKKNQITKKAVEHLNKIKYVCASVLASERLNVGQSFKGYQTKKWEKTSAATTLQSDTKSEREISCEKKNLKWREWILFWDCDVNQAIK